MPSNAPEALQAYRNARTPAQRAVLDAAMAWLAKAFPHLTPRVAWGIPFYDHQGPLLYLNHQPNGSYLMGFYLGAVLEDPKGLLIGTGKMVRHVPIPNSRCHPVPGLADLIHHAMAVNQARKAQQQPATKRPR